MSETKKYKGSLDECEKENSALNINDGVVSQSIINPNFKRKLKKDLSVDEFVDGILSSNINILSQAITLTESRLPQHIVKAQKIIERCLKYSGNSVRIGITGVPGVGKSTFIESFGLHLLSKNKKIAVLAIDPSSERNKGSILGDKTRMEELSIRENVYIRPSPSAGNLGGVARKTKETILLCEAAGFDTIFIETVGVGQSETAIYNMVDFFLLLMLSNAGDELQGIKRGIMELADTIVITKADGDNQLATNIAKTQLQNALHYFPKNPSDWLPTVLSCSALKNIGIEDIWTTIEKYISLTKDNKYFYQRRKEQSVYWMYEAINQRIKDEFYSNPKIIDNIDNAIKRILNNEITSFQAAESVFEE